MVCQQNEIIDSKANLEHYIDHEHFFDIVPTELALVIGHTNN